MEKILLRKKIAAQSIIILLSIVASVLLPEVFHLVGAVSGMGSSLGSTFLPMHLAVLFVGLIAGAVAGGIVGAVSPAISFGISGMPVFSLLPYMCIELAAYGIVCGMLRKSRMPIVCKVILAQAAGRILKAALIMIAVRCFDFQAVAVLDVWYATVQGLPGILLQLVLIPLLIFRFNGLKKYYE